MQGKTRIKPLFILCTALMTVAPAVSADVNSDMNQFFNKLGFALLPIPHSPPSGRDRRQDMPPAALYMPGHR
ncbi:conjugative transfer: assembly [Salmonella enterica subsp. enterica serovar Pullorum]|nr:conjugative transfer: assembly [Salmonella enterica subsp. enterica serovar Pullorum]